jgi:hypothetical protein
MMATSASDFISIATGYLQGREKIAGDGLERLLAVHCRELSLLLVVVNHIGRGFHGFEPRADDVGLIVIALIELPTAALALSDL